MSCQAIKGDGHLCRNWSMIGHRFCGNHRRENLIAQNNRWILKFIIGYNGSYPFNYSYSSGYEKQRILSDLSEKRHWLTERHIRKIPAKARYIDIFTLLCENGLAKPTDNMPLYLECIRYLIGIRVITTPFLSKNFGKTMQAIRSCFIPESIEDTLFFLKTIPSLFVVKTTGPIQTQNVLRFQSGAIEILETIKETSFFTSIAWLSAKTAIIEAWEPLEGTETGGSLFHYMKTDWYPALIAQYKQLKSDAKERLSPIKESIIAAAWHPDRMEKWLELSYDPDE